MSTVNKIILFGPSGMLGRHISSYFSQNTKIQVVNTSFRILNETLDSLESELLNQNIDSKTCVINCIGLIPQRKAKTSPDSDYFLINSIFPQLLWNICKKYDAKMIQPTTDCVFSGKAGNYVETDLHDETNAYGMSKSLGEPYGCTVIRTSIIGKEVFNKKSFLEWVLSNENSKINGFTNHLWNGITCLEYCKIIEKIIEENLFWVGVRHIYSPTAKNKYELSKIISDVFEANVEVVKNETMEKCDKTLSSVFPNLFDIPELFSQINDLKYFELV